MGAGLSSCIANPSSGRLREAKAAGDVLMGHDRDAAAFEHGYAMWTPATGGAADAAAFRGRKNALEFEPHLSPASLRRL